MNEAIIEPGQIWHDRKSPERRLKVTSVEEELVIGWTTHSADDYGFESPNRRMTRIQRKRFTSAFTVVQPIGTDTEQIAREEITQHYADQVADARKAYEEAAAALAAAERARDAWTSRGQITSANRGVDPDNPVFIANQVLRITADSQSRYMAAARVAIDNRGDAQLHAEAEEARDRSEALLRWLTAQGHELGALARDSTRGGNR